MKVVSNECQWLSMSCCASGGHRMADALISADASRGPTPKYLLLADSMASAGGRSARCTVKMSRLERR